MSEQKKIEVFVGENSAFYLQKWQNRNGFFVSWNWAAFLFQGFWFAYRKMYLYAALNVLIFVILLVLSNYLPELDIFIPLCLLLFAALSNSVYKMKYIETEKQYSGEELAGKGGTSVLSVSVFGLFFLAVDLVYYILVKHILQF